MPSIELTWDPAADEIDSLQVALDNGTGWFISHTLYKREKYAEDAAVYFSALQPRTVEEDGRYRIAIKAGPRPLAVLRQIERIRSAFYNSPSEFALVVPVDE